MEKHQRLGAGRPTKTVKGALKIGSRLMQEHGDIELRAAARGMGYDVSAASRSDLIEMIAAGVVEGAGVHVRGWGRGGGAEGEGQRHWAFQWQGSQGQRTHYWSERPAEHARRKPRSAGKGEGPTSSRR
jgi:hypothetical protein